MNFVYKLFFIFSIIFLAFILLSTNIYFPADENSPETIIIQIPNGTNATKIRDILVNNKLIKDNPLLFNVYIRVYKIENKLKYGEYALSPSMNLVQILNKLLYLMN